MLNNTQTDTDANEMNFTAFTDLCRFCSLRHGAKINLFEKEAEQRQILYKVRSFLPIAVNIYAGVCDWKCEMDLLLPIFRYPKMIFCRKKFANDASHVWNSFMNGKQSACKVIQCFAITRNRCAPLQRQSISR